jgi:hypothetical protein
MKRAFGLLGWALALAGCRSEILAPPGRTGPPYLAVVTRTRSPEGITVTTPYEYRIEELSQTLNIDTTLTVAPSDTVILSVPAATYRVTLSGLPPKCHVQGSPDQAVVIPEGTNTALLRYLVLCEAQLFLENLTDGQQKDTDFIYRIVNGSGAERVGLIRANDTVLLDGFQPGQHTLRLSHVAPNCHVVSNGGEEQSVEIAATGTQYIPLRISCSDPVHQPELLFLAGRYQDGVSGFLFRARDPDRDIDRYAWDLTDCRRRSVLPQGGRSRIGLTFGRTAKLDTIQVMGAFEVGRPDAEMQSGCVAIRLIDLFGNTTAVVEAPLTGSGGAAPTPTDFNAVLIGTQAIRTTVAVADADDDFLGVFAAARLRDGVLGPPDGNTDFGVFNPSGYLGTQLPDVPLGSGRPPYTDYYSIILFLFDQRGNFRRIEDGDLFR